MFRRIINIISFLLYRHKSFDDSVASWAEAKSASSGYSSDVILNNVRNTYLKSQKKIGSYERDSVLLDDGIMNWTLIAMIHWCSLNNSNKVSVLDFGGSFASQFFQNKKFLEKIDLKWSIVEQKNFVHSAQRIIKNKNINFYEEISICLAQQEPNFALFGSSLQYLENPYQIIEKLASDRVQILMLDRIPMHQGEEDIIVIQRVPKYIYDASYPAWIFSEEKLTDFISNSWVLVNTFESIGGRQKTRKGIKFSWKGHIYVREGLLKS